MSHSSAPERATGAVITDWRPEDPAFWQQRGQRIASRNLWISVPCLLLAFCVWMLFSAVAVNLPKVGFNFTTDQLFMLTALPSVSGALLRVPYSFMVPIFGGRRWTAFSTGILIIPCVWLGFAVQDTSTPYSVFIIISLLCGFAGANFASSMANISFFFPKQKQGGALGLNGGLGNMGVSVCSWLLRWWYHCRFSQYLVARASNSRMGLSCIWRMRPGYGCRSLPSSLLRRGLA